MLRYLLLCGNYLGFTTIEIFATGLFKCPFRIEINLEALHILFYWICEPGSNACTLNIVIRIVSRSFLSFGIIVWLLNCPVCLNICGLERNIIFSKSDFVLLLDFTEEFIRSYLTIIFVYLCDYVTN